MGVILAAGGILVRAASNSLGNQCRDERRSGLGFVQKTFGNLVLGIRSLVWYFLFVGTSPLDFIFAGTSPLGSLQQVWSSLQENDGSCGHLWLPLFLRK